MKVTIIKGGPVVITGDGVELVKEDGSTEIVAKIAICRCGKTKNDSRCDGSHRTDNAN